MTEAERATAERLLGGLEDEDDEVVEDVPGLIVRKRKSAIEAAIEENSHLFDDDSAEAAGALEAANIIEPDDRNLPPDLELHEEHPAAALAMDSD